MDPLAARALAFAVRCHRGHRRDSDGLPFIQHPLEVARLLRDVALLFAAEKISEVREWPQHVGREQARLRELPPDSRARRYVEQHCELRLEHYRASLAMLERVVPGHPLVTQLAQELECCSTTQGTQHAQMM